MFLHAYQQGNPYRHAPYGPLAAGDSSTSVDAQTVVRPTVVLGQREIFTRWQISHIFAIDMTDLGDQQKISSS